MRRRLEEAGVDVPAEVRRRLQELAWEVELKERMPRFERAVKRVKPAARGTSARSARADREGR